MKWIKKGKEPNKLALHRNSGGTWFDFSLDKGKKEVKEQLLLEQNNLCAYCTRLIAFENMKVEHWASRDQFPEKQLEYTNFLGVCKGYFGVRKGLEEHCDTSKKESNINLSPLKQAHIDDLSYNNIGELFSKNTTHRRDINSTLNLNITPLKKARKEVLQNLKLGLHKKYKNKKANYQKELSKWKNYDKPFCMVVITYLEKKVTTSHD